MQNNFHMKAVLDYFGKLTIFKNNFLYFLIVKEIDKKIYNNFFYACSELY